MNLFQRKTVRFVASSVVFAILVCAAALVLSVLLQTPGSALSRKRAIAQREKNSIDILVIGNSHAYCTFNPEVMEKITNKRVFNAGMPDQKIDMLYYTVLEALDRQNPQTVILEGFAFGRSDSSYQGYVANMDAMTPGFNKVKASFEIFPDKFEAARMLFSLYRSHSNWKKPQIIKNNLKYMLGMPDNTYKNFTGFYRLDSKMSEETADKYRGADGIKFAPVVDEYTSDYFRRIAGLCNDRNIRLVVAMAPFNDIYLSKVNYTEFSTKLDALCKSENAEYVDFNNLYDEVGLNYDDFEDAFHHAQHMNIWGAEKVSTYMVEYLED